MKRFTLITILLCTILMVSCGSAKQAAKPAEQLSETPAAVEAVESTGSGIGTAEITSSGIDAAETTIAAVEETNKAAAAIPATAETKSWPVPVMYHLIMEEPYSKYEALFVKPSDFESHVARLQEDGYKFVFADEYELQDGKSVVLTFDDGYLDNYTTMFPIIQKYGAKVTIFLISNMIGTDGYMTEDQIKEMSESGLVHFGCHTMNHSEVPSLGSEKLKSDLEGCKTRIEEITGKPCKSFAYPAGKYDDNSKAIVGEYFDAAYTTKGAPTEWPSKHLIPRVYASRGDSAEALSKKIVKMSKKLTVDIK